MFIVGHPENLLPHALRQFLAQGKNKLWSVKVIMVNHELRDVKRFADIDSKVIPQVEIIAIL